MYVNMRKFLFCLAKIFIKPLDFIMMIFYRRRHLNAIFSILCHSLESKTEYATYKIIPKKTFEIPLINYFIKSNNFAIILQGTLCSKDDMTLNSIKYYKKVYPYAKIIVSTWNDEPEEEINKLLCCGAIIVKSELPKERGIINVNYQLINSLAGVKKAKELGCEFSVKTRTDQRVCKAFIFDMMISAVKLFKGLGTQKGRIVTLGVGGGGMFIPYHTCDFLYLGHTDDLINLFSVPLDFRKDVENRRDVIAKFTRRQCAEQELGPEIYIMKHYCEDVLGLKCRNTVEDYWNVVKNYLICFGMKDVDLMWKKYDHLYNMNFFASEYKNNDSPERMATMCFDFFNWFNLYVGNIKYDERYEKYADVALIDDGKKDS